MPTCILVSSLSTRYLCSRSRQPDRWYWSQDFCRRPAQRRSPGFTPHEMIGRCPSHSPIEDRAPGGSIGGRELPLSANTADRESSLRHILDSQDKDGNDETL